MPSKKTKQKKSGSGKEKILFYEGKKPLLPSTLKKDVIEGINVKSLEAIQLSSSLKPGDIVRVNTLDGRAQIGMVIGQNSVLITHMFDPHEQRREHYKKISAYVMVEVKSSKSSGLVPIEKIIIK